MTHKFLPPILSLWRRRQYGTLPIIDGQARICNVSFATPEIDEMAFDVPEICNQQLDVPAVDTMEFRVPTICDQSFSVPDDESEVLV